MRRFTEDELETLREACDIAASELLDAANDYYERGFDDASKAFERRAANSRKLEALLVAEIAEREEENEQARRLRFASR